MTQNKDFHLNPTELVQTLQRYWKWWVVPAVACAAVAAAYSLVAPRNWRATQTLTLRPEASSVSEQRLGKFADLSEMKVEQATILELAKSQSVVEATLKSVGPQPSWFGKAKNWPTAQDIEDFRKQIDMRPPGGAEFGQTEVFYLSVVDTNRDRATALLSSLVDQLELRMQSLRDDRAQSMVLELENTVAMAEKDLDGRTAKLSKFESAIGADLIELRNLNATSGSQSAVSQEMQAIAGEQRSNDSVRRENEQLLTLLKAVEHDPAQLIATPSSLLKSQPAISRLKNALIDAQIRTSNLLGTYADEHPFVVGARESETLIKKQLRDEIATAIKGLEVDLNLSGDRAAALEAKSVAGSERIARLAGSRAEYANLVAAVENHTKLVEAARKNLADARADRASAHAASVIGRIDGVEAGVRPVGPGRTTITAAGGVAGLILGLGAVFLFAAPVPVMTANDVQVVAEVPVKTVAPERAATTHEPFGLFRGLSLAEAIRDAESRGKRATK
ncbi:MAG: Wzz/FepE/Etk N-terminal domain-containing protein [Pirellulales bacterium]